VIIVVDANVVISALVAKGVSYRVFLLNFLLNKFDFIAPEFLWREVEKHKAMLLEETKLSPDEFDEILDFLKEEIVIVPARDFIKFLPEAEKVSPDPKDKQYFALAIAFNCGIFSGDLKLKEQSKVKIYSPSKLLNILQSGRKYCHG
jgi:predicted nucleic acid-binding protein